MGRLTEQVDQIEAVMGQLKAPDPELARAVEDLKALCVESDDLDARFHAGYRRVRDLLVAKLEGR
jgi:hypothetical protein